MQLTFKFLLLSVALAYGGVIALPVWEFPLVGRQEYELVARSDNNNFDPKRRKSTSNMTEYADEIGSHQHSYLRLYPLQWPQPHDSGSHTRVEGSVQPYGQAGQEWQTDPEGSLLLQVDPQDSTALSRNPTTNLNVINWKPGQMRAQKKRPRNVLFQVNPQENRLDTQSTTSVFNLSTGNIDKAKGRKQQPPGMPSQVNPESTAHFDSGTRGTAFRRVNPQDNTALSGNSTTNLNVINLKTGHMREPRRWTRHQRDMFQVNSQENRLDTQSTTSVFNLSTGNTDKAKGRKQQPPGMPSQVNPQESTADTNPTTHESESAASLLL